MEVDAPGLLLPCGICGRTFMPRSLEKHAKICERAITKKRKPFDSAKQRIQGTDLAEFLPRQGKKRHVHEEKRKSSWKETHDDFLQTIRAARGRTSDTEEQVVQRQSNSNVSLGVPMRANEKGACPTCNRRFGVKAYDRHVAWCKERSTRLPNQTPTTNNVAKERLEARMKYRAPGLKNRRTNNREKYSQSSASAPNIVGNTGRSSASAETTARNASSRTNRRRETASVSDARRSGKSRESQRSAMTTTSRGELSAHISNSMEMSEGANLTKRSSQLTDRPTSSASRFIGLPAPTTLRLPLSISLNHKKKNQLESLRNDPVQSPKYPCDGDKLLTRRTDDGNAIEEDHRTNSLDRPPETSRTERKPLSSARSRKTINSISARSRAESKVNDVTVNDNDLGMLVRPCNIYTEDQLITWEKISRDKQREYRPFTARIKNDVQQQESNLLTRIENYSSIEEETPPVDFHLSLSSPVEETVGNVAWSSAVRELNQTYLIKDSSADRQDEEKTFDDQKYESSHRSSPTEFQLITEPLSADRRSDSISTHEDNPNYEITEKSDNENVSPVGTKAISEEKDFDCHDSELLRCKELSEDEENSSHGTAGATESEIDLPKALCEFKEDGCYEIEEEFEEKDEVLNDQNQKLSEELCESSIEYHATSETCEFEEEIIDHENTVPEIPLSSRTITSVVRNGPCKEQDMLTDVSEDVETFEPSTPKNEKEIWEDNPRFVESPNKTELYSPEYVDEKDIIVEKDTESVYEANKNESDDCNKDNVEELPPENVEVENVETRVEEPRFKTPTTFHNKLERPLPIPIPIHRMNFIRIDSKIQKNMNLLRGSTDTLISSVEAVDLAHGKRSNELNRNSTEEDNVDVVYGQSKYEKSRILPVIKSGYANSTYVHERSPKNGSRTYWEKASKFSHDRSIDNLVQDYKQNKLRKRNPKIRILPPVLIDQSPRMQSGTSKEYDPFLLAERQMHDLLSDSSELSTPVTEVGLSEQARKGSSKMRESCYPLSHSSAFVEYPSRNQSSSACLDKRSVVIAVPNGNGEFEKLASDFSSDSTETNSISREIFLRGYHESKEKDREKEENSRGRTRSDSSKRELGRRLILDKSIVLGNDLVQEGLSRRFLNDKLATKNSRSLPSRSQPIRAYSAPKSIYERNNKTNDGENANIEKRERGDAILDNDRKNDYAALSSSDLSLSSIVSSEVDIKRSNSVLDELITSFEDDVLGNDSFPSLRSLLRNESLQSYESCNSPSNMRQQRCDRISDEEDFSSPDNYKQQEHKFNADSAYSSLNRKSNYSNHGRSTNDATNRFEENSSRNSRRENQTNTPMSTGKSRCRMSRFCHECGSRFPETAKFCCQCGIKRLAL